MATVSPGDIVVPLSTILDQLKGKLSTAEVNALLAAILARRKSEVRPGDLITADLINQILAELADLQTRVSVLEGSTGGPLLTSRSPIGDLRVGELLTLFGSGFDPTPGNNTVFLDSVAVNAFLGGSDPTRLLLQVPDLFVGLPRLVEAAVKVGTRVSNTLQLRVLPRQDPQGGQIVILPQTAALGEIVVGQTYTLRWLVDAQTALPASYRFRLVFSELAGATESAWTVLATLDPNGERQIVRGNPLAVTAAVTVPGGSSKAQIALEVKSSDGLFQRTSAPIPFDTGTTPEVSDDRAILTLPSAIGPFDGSGNPNPLRSAKIAVGGNQLDGLQLKFGASGDIPFKLFVTAKVGAAGDYAYSAEVEAAGGAWQIESVTPLSHTGLTALGERTITVRLRNTDSLSSTAVKYMVVRAQHRPAGTSTGDFVSFIRFPIQAYSA